MGPNQGTGHGKPGFCFPAYLLLHTHTHTHTHTPTHHCSLLHPSWEAWHRDTGPLFSQPPVPCGPEPSLGQDCRAGMRAREWPLTLSYSALVRTRQGLLRVFLPEGLCSVQ